MAAVRPFPMNTVAIKVPVCRRTAASQPGPVDVIVVGAGMVGTAAAAYLADSHGAGVALIGPGTGEAHSSHDDYSRVVNAGWRGQDGALRDEDGLASIGMYRAVERESGINFFHDCGYLVVGVPADGAEHGAEATMVRGDAAIRSRWPWFSAAGVAASNCALFEARGAGWIDPRAHVRAHLALARRRGAVVVEHPVVRVQRRFRGSEGVWRVTLADGTHWEARKVALALGAWINHGMGIPDQLQVEVALWGKHGDFNILLMGFFAPWSAGLPKSCRLRARGDTPRCVVRWTMSM